MKIYFCTTAPSRRYKSWSNIPYLLHKNLEKRGYDVENYVMRELEPLKTAFNLPIRLMNKILKCQTTYYYVRTPVHFCIANLYSHWIALISKRQDVMIVQGFSYPINNRKNRQVIIGDWPSEYLFEKFLKRPPSRLERRSIDRENAVIEAADAVVTLFPSVRDYMLTKYNNKKIFCFGNVVNADEDVEPPADTRELKVASKRFLFVGQAFYLQGALELIAAAAVIRQKGYECEVDIVGIDPKFLRFKYEWLRVHGYLDKERPKDKRQYYELLTSARVFVNTTTGWSGFQALLEAMYFSTPVIVRPNEILRGYFSDLTSVAHVLEEGGPRLEALLIESLTNTVKYGMMSEAARSAVESLTWDNFTSKLIGLLE